MRKAKQKSLLLLSATGFLTLVLAMSISTITLAPGEPFALGKTDITLPGMSEMVPGHAVLIWLLRGFGALIFVLVLMVIISSLFSAQGRQHLVIQLVAAAILTGIIIYLLEHSPGENLEPAGATVSADMSEDLVDDPLTPLFSAGEAPSWLVTIVILVASLLGTGLIGAGFWFLRQRAIQITSPLHSLAETAQSTLESLRSGEDFSTAIIRCYCEMNRVIEQERGISRETAMTPREFETYLVSRGLPQDALETLTRLFERVRYGHMSPRTDDEVTAIDCLSRIATSCQATEIRP